MKCPFELPLTKKVNVYDEEDELDGLVLLQANGELIHTAGKDKNNLSNELDYIVTVINSHEKLIDLLRYAYSLPMNEAGDYDENSEWYEKVRQALKEAEKNEKIL